MSIIGNYTDTQILDRVRSLPSFKGFPAGMLDIWIRSRADAYDQFDDKVYTYQCFGSETQPEFKMVSTGTSNAGSFGLMNFRTYNARGCAVLKSDLIVYNSHAYGLHKGKPAYVQTAGFPYYRDGNRNKSAEELGEIFTDIIGANCHRAGTFSTLIYNWSVACLVRNQLKQFLAWLDLMNRRPLSVCILKEF